MARKKSRKIKTRAKARKPTPKKRARRARPGVARSRHTATLERTGRRAALLEAENRRLIEEIAALKARLAERAVQAVDLGTAAEPPLFPEP